MVLGILFYNQLICGSIIVIEIITDSYNIIDILCELMYNNINTYLQFDIIIGG